LSFEQYAYCRPGYVGVLCTDLNIAEAVEFAVQRTRQVRLQATLSRPAVYLK
jgi:hypothetical protein